jgi:hypothetical protein
MAIGSVLHKFVEHYLTTGNIEQAISACYKCVYDGSDGKTYIIDPDTVNPSTATFEEIKQSFKTKVVDFKKT